MQDATANPAILSSGGGAPRASAVASPTPISAESTDEQMMEALREGSEPAFDALFQRCLRLKTEFTLGTSHIQTAAWLAIRL